jgi:hypothetical protein
MRLNEPWVLFYGKGARVLELPELVEMIRAEIIGMNDQYLES